jgi:hypothetical protein
MPKPPKSFGPSEALDQAMIDKHPEISAANVRRRRNREAMRKYRENLLTRDAIVIECLDSGITEYEVEDIMGVARSTIRRILANAGERS